MNVQPLILVTNHDTVYLQLMSELLTEEGYRVMVAPVITNSYLLVEKYPPDLIILDVHITNPDASWLLLNLIRLNPKTTHIPVLLCSANTQLFQDSKERLESLGCETIEKPFLLNELLEKVQYLLAK